MDILLEQIKINDKTKVLNLFKEAAKIISNKNVNHWQYWKNQPIEKKWVEEGMLNDEFFFIKSGNGQNIGMVRIAEEYLLYWGQKVDKAKYIHSLVVIKEFEGKGIGTLILQRIENEAKKDGYEYLRLDCDSKNPKLCDYYEKQGFKKTGAKVLPLSTYNLHQKKLFKNYPQHRV